MTNTQKLEAKISILESTTAILWAKYKEADDLRNAALKAWSEVNNELKDAQRELEIETLVAQRLCGVDA